MSTKINEILLLISDAILGWIGSASTGDLIHASILFLVCIEQILYNVLGSYVYRIGLPVKKVSISDEHIVLLTDKEYQPRNVVSKIIPKNKDVYLRNNYLIGWGPQLFVGQIRLGASNLLTIRTGIFSILFVLMGILGTISGIISQSFEFRFVFHRLINLGILFTIAAYMYIRFLRSIGMK